MRNSQELPLGFFIAHSQKAEFQMSWDIIEIWATTSESSTGSGFNPVGAGFWHRGYKGSLPSGATLDLVVYRTGCQTFNLKEAGSNPAKVTNSMLLQ
jgi:hypothetical protein